MNLYDIDGKDGLIHFFPLRIYCLCVNEGTIS